MPNQLFPEVLDAGVLQPKATSDVYLPIAVEGAAGAGATATIATPYAINRVDESATLFGAASPIHKIIKAVLDRGAGPVIAIASVLTGTPTLTQRQTAWQKLESDETIRIRLTDSEVQSDIVALGTSASLANLIYNKQYAFVGMPSGTTKANLLTARTAIGTAGMLTAQRTVMLAPGVYDANGTLQGGSFAAAALAAEVAKNPDPSIDLDLWPVMLLTGIEKGTDGLPVFRRQVVAGVAVNDFEDLLQGGLSPLMMNRLGSGVQTTHIRTAYTADTTFDNFYTLVIVDQVFLDVKRYVTDGNFLRMPNTEGTRLRIKSGVEAVLNERSSWISKVTQPDNTQGYNVSVVSSSDMRQITIGYEGTVVRGINTVRVAPTLTIPV
jgi:hypothetical protein